MRPLLKVAAVTLVFVDCVVPPPPASPAAAVAAAPPPDAPAPPPADPAHDAAHWFPFPARGASAPTGLVDLSALDATPAGAHGFVRAKEAHFVDGTGARIRFFGVDLTATACFPSHETATRLAATCAAWA